ncbi:hypothetical protein ADK64_32990 [Streptomyces sp. MMG1121]|nr:hypothetical protein ADK64_32990 [Streptomyces sp. MMG1121]
MQEGVFEEAETPRVGRHAAAGGGAAVRGLAPAKASQASIAPMDYGNAVYRAASSARTWVASNATVPDQGTAALRENLGYVLQTCALMCVMAPDGVQGEAIVQAASTTLTPNRSS